MTWLDVLLQRWRRSKALRHVAAGSRILDIGTHDGGLFIAARGTGLGIDPELVLPEPAIPGVVFVRGYFPEDLGEPPPETFDVATALAVVEHVPEGGLDAWAERLADLLRPGGRVVITVPSPAVDSLLHVLMRLRLVAGMEAHQHHGFAPDDLIGVFSPPHWRLTRRARFQLGLNNLFVFERL